MNNDPAGDPPPWFPFPEDAVAEWNLDFWLKQRNWELEEEHHKAELNAIKLVTKTAREQCKHEEPVELRKNRFKCEECGYEYRMVRQSVIKRGLYLRSARSLHRGK